MALGFFSRLKEGLTRSTQKLTENITAVFKKRTLDDAALESAEGSVSVFERALKRALTLLHRTPG